MPDNPICPHCGYGLAPESVACGGCFAAVEQQGATQFKPGDRVRVKGRIATDEQRKGPDVRWSQAMPLGVPTMNGKEGTVSAVVAPNRINVHFWPNGGTWSFHPLDLEPLAAPAPVGTAAPCTRCTELQQQVDALRAGLTELIECEGSPGMNSYWMDRREQSWIAARALFTVEATDAAK